MAMARVNIARPRPMRHRVPTFVAVAHYKSVCGQGSFWKKMLQLASTQKGWFRHRLVSLRRQPYEAGAIGPRRVGFGWLCAVWVDLSTARIRAHMPMAHMPVDTSPVPATSATGANLLRPPYGHMHTRRVRLGPAGWDLGGFVPFGSI